MTRQELDLHGAEGQGYFREIDDHLLHSSLTGRKICRALGEFGTKGFNGIAYLLDDDSVFTLNRRSVSQEPRQDLVVEGERANLMEDATLHETLVY